MQNLPEFLARIHAATDSAALESLRIEIFGKKSALNLAFAALKNLPPDEKISRAKELNSLKMALENAFSDKKSEISAQNTTQILKNEKIDASLFGSPRENPFSENLPKTGHPINFMKDKIISYFSNLGYALCDGPLIEDDFFNFSALNIPDFHPARDMQDTFYFGDGRLLRTHTSPVQIREMQKNSPPLKLIAPGAVFRRDYDLTHTPMFHQIEGLVVDPKKTTSFANLKHTLHYFLRFIFGDVQLRFRSSFFPFTEPSAEVDISCIFCKNSGCRVCKNTGWLEVLGCGMVDDRVFRSVGYENVSGFAFGMGIERLAMLSYRIDDLRSFFEMDLRAMGQF